MKSWIAVRVVFVVRNNRSIFIHRLPHGTETIRQKIANLSGDILRHDNTRQVEICFAGARLDDFRQSLNVQDEGGGNTVGSCV